MIHLNIITASIILVLIFSSAQIYASDTDFFKIIENVESSANTPSTDIHNGYLQQTLKYGWQTSSKNEGMERRQAGITQIKTNLYWESKSTWTEQISWRLAGKGEAESYQWNNNHASWRLHNNKLFLKDAFLDVTFDGGIWARAGHQILAWGQSEGLAVTDVFSPLDLREPWQAEIRDIREQVPALMVSLPFSANVNISTAITFDANSNRYGEQGDAFDFFLPFRNLNLGIDLDNPDNEWEFGVKLDKQLNGGDFSLIAARVNFNDYALEKFSIGEYKLEFGRPRHTMLGLAANKAKGNWLIKAEFASWRNVPTPSFDLDRWPATNQFRSMVGVEYAGFANTFINLELNKLQLEEWASSTITNEDPGFVLRIQHSAINSRLIQHWWALKAAGENVHVARWDVTWQHNDHWSASIGAVIYQVRDGTSPFFLFRNNDSLNFSIKYAL